MPAFIDTNVLVYAFDDSDARKQDLALAILASPESLVLSAQVLGEYYVTVTRKLARPVAPADAAAAVAELSLLTVVPTDAGLITSAISTASGHALSYWDALIVEAAAASGCDRLLTEDLADGSVLRGVRIENPFA